MTPSGHRLPPTQVAESVAQLLIPHYVATSIPPPRRPPCRVLHELGAGSETPKKIAHFAVDGAVYADLGRRLHSRAERARGCCAGVARGGRSRRCGVGKGGRGRRGATRSRTARGRVRRFGCAGRQRVERGGVRDSGCVRPAARSGCSQRDARSVLAHRARACASMRGADRGR